MTGETVREGRLRVAILRADDHHHRYLESLLRSRYDVRGVVVERAAPKLRRMRRNRRYRDYAYNLYHHYRRVLTGKDAYRRRYFAHSPELWRMRPENTTYVDAINSEETVRSLRASGHEVTVVIGCSILRAPVMAAAGDSIINVHGGLLPHYRGNHTIFFAVYDGRLDRVGATLHYIDAGVDRGPIIDAVRPVVEGTRVPERLYCRAERVAINRLPAVLDMLQSGTDPPSLAQPGEGAVYRTRDRGPAHDLRLLFRRAFRAGATR